MIPLGVGVSVALAVADGVVVGPASCGGSVGNGGNGVPVGDGIT